MTNPVNHQLTDDQARELVTRAIEARQWAYAPYSHYFVGSALLTASGKIYDGVNIENAAYPMTICAERVAASKAVSEGEREFIAISVVTENAGTPCGACRQFLAEFGIETIVVIANAKGEITQLTTVKALLPDSFGPGHLK
jgi:cytidine deaminase